MPIYEYVCDSCKKKTEVIQAMNAPRLKVCPHCGGKLKKAFSAPAIQFKGSGFYLTDYARGSGAGDNKAGEGSKSDSGEKSEKAEKSEKSDASEKSAKSEKSDKPAKAEKAEKAEKKKDKKAD